MIGVERGYIYSGDGWDGMSGTQDGEIINWEIGSFVGGDDVLLVADYGGYAGVLVTLNTT
jgi:hypothetical protein